MIGFVHESLQNTKADLHALNELLAELHHRLAQIEERREARKRAKELDEWCLPLLFRGHA